MRTWIELEVQGAPDRCFWIETVVRQDLVDVVNSLSCDGALAVTYYQNEQILNSPYGGEVTKVTIIEE